MDSRKSVSIIIVDFNSKHLLEQYLPHTLATVNEAGFVYEIIIIDDASTDGSAEFIKKLYPQTKLIVNPEHKGFFYSFNRGIEIAKYELILLLYPDIKLTTGFFDNQWKYFLRWDTFGVMGRINEIDGEKVLNAAYVPRLSGQKLVTDYTYYTKSKSDRLFTYYQPGGNILMDAKKLKELGGFYELFQDVNCGLKELGVRVWRTKWKCYYEHNAICRKAIPHVLVKDYEYYCGVYYLQAIHLNGFSLKLWHLQVLLTDVLPKMLSGKKWIWSSYLKVFENKTNLKQHKEAIAKLMNEKDSVLTLSMAVNKIRAAVKSKSTIRFKSGF